MTISYHEVSIPVTYQESYLPTKRHRKSRWREVTKRFAAMIPSVTKDDAPVAIVQRGWLPNGFSERFEGGQELAYRWWGDALWARPRLSHFMAHPQSNSYARLEDVVQHRSLGHRTIEGESEAATAASTWAQPFLLVDGDLHMRLGEPVYVVMTFGLGHNHGGTAVTADNSYNPNIHRDRYFRIDQPEHAIALATRIAQTRKDTHDLPMKADTTFEILIPAAIRRQPDAEHGTGDPFLNKMYALTESGLEPAIVGLLGIAEAFKPTG